MQVDIHIVEELQLKVKKWHMGNASISTRNYHDQEMYGSMK